MANVYNVAKLGFGNGEIDLEANSFEIALFTTAPTTLSTTQKNDLTMTDAIADAGFVEPTGEGTYTANGTTGRVALGAITVTQDDTNDRMEADVGNITYTAIDNITIEGAIIYKVVGAAGPSGDGTHIPVAFYALSQVTNGGDIILQIDAEGFLHLT